MSDHIVHYLPAHRMRQYHERFTVALNLILSTSEKVFHNSHRNGSGRGCVSSLIEICEYIAKEAADKFIQRRAHLHRHPGGSKSRCECCTCQMLLHIVGKVMSPDGVLR